MEMKKNILRCNKSEKNPPDIKGGRQILERRNVERPIVRYFKIANIKITKDELFDSFVFEFNFSYFRNPLNTQNI